MNGATAQSQADVMEDLVTSSNYGFSAVRADELGASEYTLATIVVDRSSSVEGFKKEMEDALKASLESCQRSPRAENLMLRLVSFSDDVKEEHGFRLLSGIQPDEYDNCLNPYGSTALFDATFAAIEATVEYGKLLFDQEYLTNAIIFVITDGDDNRSVETPRKIKNLVVKIKKDESLESINVVLVGVNTKQANIKQYLEDFQREADITQYVDIDDATPKALAKLGKFISSSISSTSQALGSGAPSQPLTF